MVNIRKALKLILSIPKTLYFNFAVFDFKTACRFPVLVGYNTRLGKLKGNLKINTNPRPFMIKLNWGGTESRLTHSGGYFSLGKDAELTFAGKAYFSEGMSLSVDRGKMSVGNGFFCNRNCSISCNNSLTIGEHVMLGWNIEILDSDNHEIKESGVVKINSLPIVIGNNVWIAAFANILKGVVIPDGCIVAYNSFCTRKYEEERALIAGNPAKVIKHDIEWSSSTVGKEN